MQNADNLEYVKCDICGTKDHDIFIRLQDHKYGTKGEWNVVKCKNCGLFFTNPRLCEKALNAVYEESARLHGDNKREADNKHSSFVRRHPELRKAWHRVTGEFLSETLERSKGKVLDIGCGFGDMLEDLARKGCDAYGVETNPAEAEVCLKKGLKVHCGILEKAHFADESFDTIILRHVIEHLPSPKTTLKEIHRVLKPEGSVLIYCPNADSYLADLFGKYWTGWVMPVHFYHFTGKTIKDLAKRAGFDIKRMRAVTPDWMFLGSLSLSIRGRGSKFSKRLQDFGIFNTIFFRLCIIFIVRIVDLVLRGKGECLRVELKKQKEKN